MVELGCNQIHFLLYAYNILLLSESEQGLQSHLHALHAQTRLVMNLGKTKVFIFYASFLSLRLDIIYFSP